MPLPGPVEDRYRSMAREHRDWLVPGSVYERDGDLVYNTAPVIDPDGNVVCRYRKIYPWTPYEAGVASGDRCVMFDVPAPDASGSRSVTTCGSRRPRARWWRWAPR